MFPIPAVYFNVSIEIVISDLDHLLKIASIFDSWKITQNRTGWMSSGWSIKDDYTAQFFINSKIALNHEAIDTLIEKISHSCFHTTVKYSVIPLQPK